MGDAANPLSAHVEFDDAKQGTCREHERSLAVHEASASEMLNSYLDPVARGEVVRRVGQLADQFTERELDRMQVNEALDGGSLQIIVMVCVHLDD
jgi:hypothetical protein